MDKSYVIRERHRRMEAKRMLEEMRGALPVYTLEEIRQHRLPFHEALISNLKDKGYTITADNLTKLIKIQEDIREKAGPLSHVWLKAQLCVCKEELTILSDRLVKSEDYHKAGNHAMECETTLQTAVHFAFLDDNWTWLGEQLIFLSLTLSIEYKSLERKYEALTRYAYAKFLIENFKQYEPAIFHLKIARELSSGRQWTTKLIWPSETDTLFMKVNFVLYTCLISEVETLMKTDYLKAGRLAVIARKRAAEACYKDGEIKAFLLKGMCELCSNDTKGAIKSFSKAYYTQAKMGDETKICETRIQLAMAYLRTGNADLSLNTLVLLKESAEDYKLPYYLAQAYKHLGQYFLNNSEAEKATPLLAEALKIFYENDCIQESEQVRNLEAISTGLELFPKYLVLLSKSADHEYLNKLIDWKDSRKSFIDDIESMDSYSPEDIIKGSIPQLENLEEEQEEECENIELYEQEEEQEDEQKDEQEGEQEEIEETFESNKNTSVGSI